MKKIFVVVIVFLSLPTLTFAQLNDNGNSYHSKNKEQVGNLYKNTLLYSAAIPYAPLGARYQYLKKKIGFFFNIKSSVNQDDDDFIIAAGPSFKINNKLNLYLGGGYNFGYKDIDAETGVIIKWGKFAMDLGGGYSTGVGYGTLGFGFNF